MSPGRSQSSVDRTQADEVDANLLAGRGADVRREFPLSGLSRLIDLTVDADATAILEARFHSVGGNAAVAGRVTATLHLVCQRCLQPMDVPIDDQFHVVLVASEDEMDEVSETQDAVIADAARLDLAWLTEEQLLLARPLAPMHEDDTQCGRKQVPARKVAKPRDAEAETQQPFAGLRDLMNKRQ